MFETGDFQTPAPPESGVADNAVASTPQDHWLYNELVDGFHIDRVVRDYNYSMDIRHIHEEYEIYYLLEGERYYFINQQTYLVTPGTLVFIDKEQIHRYGFRRTTSRPDRFRNHGRALFYLSGIFRRIAAAEFFHGAGQYSDTARRNAPLYPVSVAGHCL